MLAFIYLLAFAAATAAPKAAPPTPVPVPVNVPTFAPVQFNTSWGAQHQPVLYLVQVLFVIAVVGLIGLMSIQTTKTEGLSGTIGGRMESAYKGRLGIEQQLARLTSGFAVAFMFLAILDFLITR